MHYRKKETISKTEIKDDPPLHNILVWKKLDIVGYQPSTREGHSAVTVRSRTFVFGGIEAGKRVNSTVVLNVPHNSWSTVACRGELPVPRCYHAACAISNYSGENNTYMVIHGGEAIKSGLDQFSMAGTSSNNHQLSSGIYHEGKQSKRRENVPLSGVCPHDGLYLSGTQNNPVKRLLGFEAQTDIRANVYASDERKFGEAVINDAENGKVVFLDDMFVLDTDILEWFRIPTALSPLGRKGHSMVVATVELESHLVVFGGHSGDTGNYSNSLHILPVEMVKRSFKSRIAKQSRASQLPSDIHQSSSSASAYVERVKSLRSSTYFNEDSCSPIWRVLHVTGSPPSPRYRHSSTVITDESTGAQLLVVIGGIGPSTHGGTSLCDAHILDMVTMTWSTIDSSQSFGLGSEGPILGVYGHVAFAVTMDPTLDLSNRTVVDDNDNPVDIPTQSLLSKYEIIIFGGSSNVHSVRSDCYQYLYCLNLHTSKWRRVQTTYSFPSARNGHSGTVLHGWAPAHTFPPSTSQKYVKFSESHQDTSCENSIFSMCAIVFGGAGSIANSTSDVWTLNLNWKPVGVEQYHTVRDDEYSVSALNPIESYKTLREKEKNFADNSVPVPSEAERRQHSYDKKYLVSEKLSSKRGHSKARCMSESNLLMRTEGYALDRELGTRPSTKKTMDSTFMESGGIAMNTTGLSAKEEDAIGREFVKLKRERAQGEQLLQLERERCFQSELLVKELRDELDVVKLQLSAALLKSDREVTDLRSQLEMSLQREQDLIKLNEEAHNIILLNEIKKL